MKNLTIKKVALGLFLAGYAASSAFALAPVATQNVIEGNVPVLKSRGSTPIPDAVTVDIFHANGSPYTSGDQIFVGDKVHVKYRLTDADGDSDNATAAKVKDSFKIFTKATPTSAWVQVSPTVTASYDVTDPELGELVFEITNDFMGKSQIGFVIRPSTEFGLPSQGAPISVGNIFGGGSPVVGGNGNNPGNGGGGPGGGGNSSGGNTGGGNAGPGTNPGPIVSQSSRLGIFVIDSTGNITNNESLAKNGTPLKPVYGERYAAVVWEDANNDSIIDNGENDLSANFTFEWHVVGNGITENGNVGAETGTLNGDGNRQGTNDTIFLGSRNLATDKHNSIYSSFTRHKAGIQGYQLQVKTN